MAGKAKRAEFLVLAMAVIAVAAIHAWLAVALPEVLRTRYLEREMLVSQQLLAGLLATEPRPGELFAEPAPSPTLVSFAAHVRHIPGVVRANVYSPDGFIRHSTDPNLIGVHFGDNPELARGFRGEPVATLLEADEIRKEEHLALNLTEGTDVLEAYVPVVDPAGRIAAVVEFYRKDTHLAAAGSEIGRLLWIAAAVNVLLVPGVGFLLLRLARRG